MNVQSKFLYEDQYNSCKNGLLLSFKFESKLKEL